jgi:hypothetical protein
MTGVFGPIAVEVSPEPSPADTQVNAVPDDSAVGPTVWDPAEESDQPLVRGDKLHAAGGRVAELLQEVESQRKRRRSGQQHQHNRQRNGELNQRGPLTALKVYTAPQTYNGQKGPPGLASTHLHDSSSGRGRHKKFAVSRAVLAPNSLAPSRPLPRRFQPLKETLEFPPVCRGWRCPLVLLWNPRCAASRR